MSTYRKSKGFLQYERDVDAIGDRVKRGEIAEKSIIGELVRAMDANAPNMNERELVAIRAWMLGSHTALAESLAADGQPVPGNDPGRPN
jgi:hypothetical protein